jgi:hypothetical protein
MAGILVLNATEGHAFAFNLTKNVGIASPNLPLDVQLVQFGYYCVARNPRSQAPYKQLAMQLDPKATYGGRKDELLSQIILADQKFRGGIQDGHVSVMRNGDTYPFNDVTGKHGFIMAILVNNMRDVLADKFPRLDLHSACPAALAQEVKRMFFPT